MAISFNSIPATTRVPFLYAEFDNSNAVQGPSQQPFKILVTGIRSSAGSVSELVPTRVTSVDQAKAFFGEGSMLHLMLKRLLKNNSVTEVVAIAQDEDAAGVKAAGSISFSGSATAAGTLALYIGGQKVPVAVGSGDSAAAIATAVAAAITAAADMPVTAAVDGVVTTKVNITFKHKCLAGNYLDIRVNYASDDETPAGVTPTIVAMTGGTTNPDIADVLAVLGDAHYNVIAFPYTDSANLAALETELDERWGPLKQIDGYAFTASNVSHANLSTLGNSRNNAHCSIIASTGIPMAPWEVAAAAAGIAAYYLSIDPARPLQTLELKDIAAPKETDRFTQAERNILLYDGIATLNVSAGGKVLIERMISTYKVNGMGGADPSYLDCMTHFTLSYIRYDWRNRILRKFPRHKLASDGVRISAGQAIVTPKTMKAEAVNAFKDWEELGLVEGIDQFKEQLIVERNATDVNRLDVMLPPDLVNQLMVTATKIGFIL